MGSYATSPQLYEHTRCTEPAFGCDETLLDLTSGGDLAIELAADGPTTYPDTYGLEIRLYRSDASGTKRSVIATEDTGTYRERATSLPAGFYIVEVSWLEGVGDFTGTAELISRPRSRRS